MSHVTRRCGHRVVRATIGTDTRSHPMYCDWEVTFHQVHIMGTWIPVSNVISCRHNQLRPRQKVCSRMRARTQTRTKQWGQARWQKYEQVDKQAYR